MKDQDRISKQNKQVKEDEIDLIELAKSIWRGRRIIINTVIIFTFLGLVVAIFSKKEYTASTIMVPQIENPSSKMGGLSSLATLAGFNLDMNAASEGISPLLYPLIISSVSFQLEIMNTEFVFEELEKPTSLFDYYSNIYKPGLFGTIKKYTIGLPGSFASAAQGEKIDTVSNSKTELVKLSVAQDEVRKIIAKKLSLAVDDKDGFLTLSSRFHQAGLSAQVTQKSQMLLQEYVTKFKVEKAVAQLEFIKERYEENKSEFEEAQSKLATFRDGNKNISSEIMRTHEERLEYEYQLAFDVYSELAKQLEQSLIKVEEDTPIFAIISEVTVPIEKSNPNRILIIILWMFLGGILGIGILLGHNLMKSFMRRWK